MDAYLTGLEQAAANGHDLCRIHSVASFFVSRVDTEVDKRLDAIGTDEAHGARGKAARRQRAARLRSCTRRSSPASGWRRWRPRAPTGSGRCGPRPGVKNPDYPDTMYVDRPGRRRHRQHDAGEDHGGVRRPRRGHAATWSPAPRREAQQVLDDLARARHRLRRRGRGARERGRREVRGSRGTSWLRDRQAAQLEARQGDDVLGDGQRHS